MSEEFSVVYDRYIADIRRTAQQQWVPGHDYDDVVSEMVTCLWQAWKTYRPTKGEFGPYWWSIWLNRRSKLTERTFRTKRPKTFPFSHSYLPDESYFIKAFPAPPASCDQTAQKVWVMLAAGEPVVDIRRELGLKVRDYYALLKTWRTDEMRTYLTDV